MRSSTASRTPASRRVDCDAPSSPSPRSVSGTSAAPTAPATASRCEIPCRAVSATLSGKRCWRTVTDENVLSVGARTPAVAATPSHRQPTAAPRLEADRGAGLGRRPAVEARGGGRRRSTAPMRAPARPARGDRHLRGGAVPDGRRGRRRDDGRVERQRDEHGGRARPLVAVSRRIGVTARVCPQRGDREAIALIGHPRNVRDAGLSLRCPGPTRAPPSPPRRWDTSPVTATGRVGGRRGDQAEQQGRAHAATAELADFCPTPIEPGRIVAVVCRPAPCSARCWPPASRSAPRRAVATSTLAAPRDGGDRQRDPLAGHVRDRRSLGVAGRRQRRHLHGHPGRRARRRARTWRTAAAYSGIATFAPIVVTSFSYLFREQPSPPEAYYGAWFFIPASPAGQILAQPAPFRLPPKRRRRGHYARSGTSTSTRAPTATLIAHLYDSAAMANFDQANPVPVPVATVGPLRDPRTARRPTRRGASRSGRTASQILDHRERGDRADGLVQWDAGGGSNDIAPSPATVYFDDATISLSRVGTGL